jgi:predicted amidohydrolase
VAAGSVHPPAGPEAIGRTVARAAGAGARWVALVAGRVPVEGAAIAAAHGVFLMLARAEPDDAGRAPEAALWSPAGDCLLHQVSAVAGGGGTGPGLLEIDGWPCGVLVGDDVRAPELGRLLQLRGALCLWCASPPPRQPGGLDALAGVWSQVQQTQCFALEAATPPGLSAVHAPCEITPGETGFLAASAAAAAAAGDDSARAEDGFSGAAQQAAGPGTGPAGQGAASDAATVIRHPLGGAIRPGSAIPGLAAARLDPDTLAALRSSYDLRRHLNPAFYRRHLPAALREPGP